MSVDSTPQYQRWVRHSCVNSVYKTRTGRRRNFLEKLVAAAKLANRHAVQIYEYFSQALRFHTPHQDFRLRLTRDY